MGALAHKARPLVIQMLGPYTVAAFGEPLTGLRSRSKMLLAWYLARPQGATVEQAVDALWPDTGPDQVLRQFWRALGDLRTSLRVPGHQALEVLEKVGDHYRAKQVEISCDLWDLESALDEASRAEDDESARSALRRAVDAYREELLHGTDYPWLEPVRHSIQRKAIDAHLRLATLEDAGGRPDTAVAVFERAIDLDPYAEEPHQRLMTLHAARGRRDAVEATWQLLVRRLSELEVEASDATGRLYSQLIAGQADQSP